VGVGRLVCDDLLLCTSASPVVGRLSGPRPASHRGLLWLGIEGGVSLGLRRLATIYKHQGGAATYQPPRADLGLEGPRTIYHAIHCRSMRIAAVNQIAI
jgi:hypothetical protein